MGAVFASLICFSVVMLFPLINRVQLATAREDSRH